MTKPKPKLEAVLTSMAAHDRARSATDDRRLQQRIATEFGAKQYAHQHAPAQQFGKINRWKLTTTRFEPLEFGRWKRRRLPLFQAYSFMDHTLYYRDSYGCLAAIVGQPYGSLDKFRWQLDDLGARYNLTWHVPPQPYASIWYPGSTLFIVITQPRPADICWLPEQVVPSGMLAKHLEERQLRISRSSAA